MTRRQALMPLALSLIAAAGLSAHDDKIHRATVGEVVAANATGLTLKTKTATLQVKYSSRTAFERNRKPAARENVKVGERVGVIGSKLPGGELMANQVLLGVPADKPAAAAKGDHKH